MRQQAKTTGVLMLTTDLVSWAKGAWASVTGTLTYLAKAALPVLWKPVCAVAVVVVGRKVARVVAQKVGDVVRRFESDDTRANFLESLTDIALVAVAVLLGLVLLGLNLNVMAAVLGAVVVGIGLSLQEQFTSLATGMILAFRQPIHTGDLVDIAGLRGRVERIGIFDTTLYTLDNDTVFIPNSKVWENNIVNHSYRSTKRLDIAVHVSYESDLGAVRDVLARMLSEDERVLAEPEPQIVVQELGSSAVVLAVRPWVEERDQLAMLYALNEKIKRVLEEANIEIPFPQMDVHMHQPGTA